MELYTKIMGMSVYPEPTKMIQNARPNASCDRLIGSKPRVAKLICLALAVCAVAVWILTGSENDWPYESIWNIVESQARWHRVSSKFGYQRLVMLPDLAWPSPWVSVAQCQSYTLVSSQRVSCWNQDTSDPMTMRCFDSDICFKDYYKKHKNLSGQNMSSCLYTHIYPR